MCVYTSDFAQQLKNVGFTLTIFVSVEQKRETLASEMCSKGLAVLDFRPEFNKPPQNGTGVSLQWTTKLRVSKHMFFDAWNSAGTKGEQLVHGDGRVLAS